MMRLRAGGSGGRFTSRDGLTAIHPRSLRAYSSTLRNVVISRMTVPGVIGVPMRCRVDDSRSSRHCAMCSARSSRSGRRANDARRRIARRASSDRCERIIGTADRSYRSIAAARVCALPVASPSINAASRIAAQSAASARVLNMRDSRRPAR